MKKTFLARRNALLSSERATWGSIALAFAIIVLALRVLLPNAFWSFMAPVYGLGNAISGASHALFGSFKNVSDLARRNEELMAQNALLMSENAALLKKDEQLQGQSPTLLGRISAGVVSRPPQSPYDTLLVGAGDIDGVKVGMGAFAAHEDSNTGIPLGIVTNVTARHARIVLLSSPQMSVNGWVGERNIPVTLRGTGAGTFSASVSRGASVAAGDIVYVSGPGMLPIGTVVRADTDESSPIVALRISPLINIFSVGWVMLKNSDITFSGSQATSTSL